MISEIGDKLEHSLVNLDRLNGILIDEVDNITQIIFEELAVVFLESKDSVQNNQLDVIVILILDQIDVALNCNFDGGWGSGQLYDCISALKENT